MFVHNSDRISQDFHNKVAVQCDKFLLTSAVWLAQSGGRWSAELVVAGSNPDRKNTQAL